MKKPKRSALSSNMLLAFSLFFLAAAIIYAASRGGNEQTVLIPERVPDADENAEKIQEQEILSGDKNVSEFLNSVTLAYSDSAEIDISSRTVSFDISNTDASENDFIVRFLVNGTPIAQSGLIKAGYKLSKLRILDNLTISEGIYDAVVDDGEGNLLPIVSRLELTVRAK